MKRVTIFGALAAGVLALALAPAALATHSATVHSESVTLGAGGSVIVSGSIDCVEGYSYSVSAIVRQRSGLLYNTALPGFFPSQARCEVTGPQRFSTAEMFGQGPFHRGPAAVTSSVSICDSFGSFYDCSYASDTRELRITD
jgi:hypothetical protein